MWPTLDQWYSDLTLYASERGQVLPAMADLAHLHARYLSVEDTYNELFRVPVVIEQELESPAAPSVDTMPEVAEATSEEFALARDLNVPAITESQIAERIASVRYQFTPHGTAVQCEIMMVNGFLHRGIANLGGTTQMDQQIAEARARARAIQAAWPFEAYLAREAEYQRQLAAKRAALGHQEEGEEEIPLLSSE